MPTKVDHARVHTRILHWLGTYADHTPGVEAFGPITDKLGRLSQPEPDGSLVLAAECGGRTTVDEDNFLAGPPELAVEVAVSTMSVDLGRKKRDYEEYGIGEYIVILPLDCRVAWFVRRKGDFVELPADEMGVYRSTIFPGLWLESSGLFASPTQKVIHTLRLGLASPEHAAFVAAQEKKLAAAKRKKKR
jgi:Uma2 family endonuclease